MSEIKELMAKLEEFFNNGLGISSLRVLKDGSFMEFLVDNESFCFRKENGRAIITPGKPEKANFVVQFTREALEDILNAKDTYNLKRRTWMHRRRGSIKFIPLRDDVAREYFFFGYHYWCRRLGIIWA
ncbi:MAG: hypothetical protein QXN40_08075 [Candidatus Bathyarchaeia archaeon]